MDVIDKAQNYEAHAISTAIENHQRRMAEIGPGDGQTHCVHCEDEIPEARRRAVPGCRLCVACQQEAEKQ